MHSRDLVGTSGLAPYAEVALVLFFLAFLAILAELRRQRSSARDWDAESRIPLDDGESDPAPGPSSSTPRGNAP